MNKLNKITRIKWELEFYDYIETFSRLFLTTTTIYLIGKTTEIPKETGIPLGIFLTAILIIWTIKPLVNKIRSEEYYEEEQEKDDRKHGK